MSSPLSARIESSENGRLNITLHDGQTFSVSADHLYGPLIPGTLVRLFLVSQSNNSVGDETLSQAMINELLNPSSP